MAEELEQQQQDDIKTTDVGEKKSRAGLWFGIIITLLLVVLAGAGFYLLQQLREHQDTLSTQDNQKLIEMSKQLNAFQSQIAAMQSQLATQGADITGKQEHFNRALADFSKLQQEKLDTAKNELQTKIQRIERQLGKTRGDWLIADAEYLLSVANERLHLVGDVNTTREALEAADQRLRESGDAAVFKVRSEIAKELAALRTVQVPDIVGLYAKVETLEGKIPQLSVLLPYVGKEISKSAPIHQHEKSTGNAHGALSAVLGQLGDYVVVRHSDKPVGEILKPEQVQFIREQLGVKLEMIKIALVQQNDALYQAAIQDALQWLKANFALDDMGQYFQQELQALANVALKGRYPDISKSLKMLKDITRLRLEKDKALGNRSSKPTAPEGSTTSAPDAPESSLSPASLNAKQVEEKTD